MNKVTGIGGVFFRCKNPVETREWYMKCLGIQSDTYGATFQYQGNSTPDFLMHTAWNPFSLENDYFPPQQPFLLNYRVNNLIELLEELKHQGVPIRKPLETFEYGLFAHIEDLNGWVVELWEPNDEAFAKILSPNAVNP